MILIHHNQIEILLQRNKKNKQSQYAQIKRNKKQSNNIIGTKYTEQQQFNNYPRSNQSVNIQDSFTNNVFCKQFGNKTIFYIPGYMRFRINSLTNMNLNELNAQAFGDIYFNIYYGGLQDLINERYRVYAGSSSNVKSKNGLISDILKKLSDSIVLCFGRDNGIKLKNDDVEIIVHKYPQRKQIKFTVRRFFNLRIQPDILWSPFQIINFILSVSAEPLIIYQNQQNFDSHQYCFEFNFMDNKNEFLKLSYGHERRYGNYQMAISYTDTIYTNNKDIAITEFKLYEKHENPNLKNPLYVQPQMGKAFSYAHFNIPYYKHPVLPLLIIFLPLWVLSIIALGIFFQNQNLGNRITAISVLMLGFIAMIPTLRSQIPSHNKFTFIQVFAYGQIISSFLCLLHSLDIRQIAGFDLTWYSTALFWIAGGFLFINVFIVVLMTCIYLFYWKSNYKQYPSKKDISQQFDRRNWRNKKCDNHFQKIVRQFKRRISKQKL